MRKSLTSYKTAALAKEKGFNKKTRHFYIEGQQSSLAHTFLRDTDWNGHEYATPRISCPSIYELQTWLREVYGIWVGLDISNAGIYPEIMTETMEGSLDLENKVTLDKCYNKHEYETALEMGIYESLKTIK